MAPDARLPTANRGIDRNATEKFLVRHAVLRRVPADKSACLGPEPVLDLEEATGISVQFDKATLRAAEIIAPTREFAPVKIV